MNNVTVVGSVNRDLVFAVDQLPKPGETILTRTTTVGTGGKGANQAVASSRLGARVRLVARIGADHPEVLDVFRSQTIDVDGVTISTTAPTGSAVVMLDRDGENMIVVSGGANAEIAEAQLDGLRFDSGDVLLVQGEIPAAVSLEAMKRARAEGATVILNPAPVAGIDREMLSCTDVLVPNLAELAELMGVDVPVSAEDVSALLEHGLIEVDVVIVTAGAAGAFLRQRGVITHVPAPLVEAVDTVGAGDTFCGALAAQLAERADLSTAVTLSVHAAAIAVTGHGAQSAMPTREQALDLLNRSSDSSTSPSLIHAGASPRPNPKGA